jgi:hypothetical protein
VPKHLVAYKKKIEKLPRGKHEMDAQTQQVENNWKAFEAQLPALLKTHPGKFALMRDGKIVEFYDTIGDAFISGERTFPEDKLFSIQEVVGPAGIWGGSLMSCLSGRFDPIHSTLLNFS